MTMTMAVTTPVGSFVASDTALTLIARSGGDVEHRRVDCGGKLHRIGDVWVTSGGSGEGGARAKLAMYDRHAAGLPLDRGYLSGILPRLAPTAAA